MLGLSCVQSMVLRRLRLFDPRSRPSRSRIAAVRSQDVRRASSQRLQRLSLPSERRVQFSGVRIDQDKKHFQLQFASEDENGTINGHIGDDGSLTLTATDAGGTIGSGGSLQ